jgi:hypothetical protein
MLSHDASPKEIPDRQNAWRLQVVRGAHPTCFRCSAGWRLSFGERYIAVRTKIDDNLYICLETMHMPRHVIHRIGRKPDAMEADRTHLFLF